ncbi:MAG: kinase-like domain-containing protein [Linnemannia gamsii]|nr:MAG: kinase-like domain-containing protein [Linnemannia gamsii]
MSTTPDLIPILASSDEAALATDVYNENQGPRKGISLTFHQAHRLIEFHLPKKQLDQLFYLKRGYNNRVYLAHCADGSEYIIRLGGRFWDHTKIINEAQALSLARAALRNVADVPLFVGTSVEESKVHTDEASRIIPHDYIIMDRLPGIPLDTVWDHLSKQDKKTIVDQAAEIFSRLRSIELTTIGNFVHGPQNEPQVGALMEGGGGPFLRWGDFISANIKKELRNLAQHESKFAEIMPYLPRIHALLDKVQSGELEKQFEEKAKEQGEDTSERPISFLHGDFESRNMLVVGTKITGLHDFEFAGGFPSEQEWCAGFEWLFARSEDPYDESEQQKMRDMTEDQKEIREYFMTILKEEHGMLPFGPGHQEYKVVLYHCQSNIAPWWLVDPERNTWTEHQVQTLRTAAASLDKALTFLGC